MDLSLAQALLDFIGKSPSPFHVVDNLAQRLQEEGYTELFEHQPWNLEMGGCYYLRRNGSSLLSFRIPLTAPTGFLMSAAHSDSPSFKLKASAERAGTHYVQLETEGYGGMLMASWFDRPLTLAGRVLIRENGAIREKLVYLDRDLLVIPNVAIHMNREANSGMNYRANVDTLPLYGGPEAKGTLMGLVAEAAGCPESDILSCDLTLACRQKGAIVGAQQEYLLSPKLDDLECVFGCAQGFLAASDSSAIPVLCVFDNEEVGSGSRQGAGSSFLRDCLRRISLSLGMTEEQHQMLLAGSFLVSADNAHAQHPNHPEYADAANCPYMNEGVVVKFAASLSYTTDALSAAVFKAVCERSGVPVQVFANRSDLRGGSTLGHIADAFVPVPTVDIGLAQLAMHSAVETAGTKDIAYLAKAMEAFYASGLHRGEDGSFVL